MKKILVACVAMILACASVASSAELSVGPSEERSYTSSDKTANLAWNAANADALRALDKAAIMKLCDILDETEDSKEAWAGVHMDFAWVDLAGDGKYELVVTTESRSGSGTSIFWQDAPGKVREQYYDGSNDLDKMIRDIDGDGIRELILIESLGGTPGSPEWPAVFRLQYGRYVEASQDFPKYYDTEVLPQLEKYISRSRQEVAEQQGKPKPTPLPYETQQMVDDKWRRPKINLADALLERAKILRVLGRDPNAGLAEAREWIKSSDPVLLEDALFVFADIGGHEQERRVAQRLAQEARKEEARKAASEGK